MGVKSIPHARVWNWRIDDMTEVIILTGANHYKKRSRHLQRRIKMILHDGITLCYWRATSIPCCLHNRFYFIL